MNRIGNDGVPRISSAVGKDGRLPALDAVRGLAVMLVVGYHASFRFPAAVGDPVAGFLRSVGWIGVDVFFALSGFLIAGILLRDHGRSSVAVFFRRRFFRIVPLFAVAVLTYLVASLAFGHEIESLSRLWMPALMLNGWTIPFLGVDAVPYTIAWSLSVEEFAYVALGVAAIFARRAIVATICGFVVVALAVRWWALASGAIEPALLYYFVPSRLDSIAFGAFGALGVYAPMQRMRHAARVAGGVVVAMMIAIQWAKPGALFLPAAGYTLFGLACAIWVSTLAALPQPSIGKLVQALARLGEVSYFIYLFHMFVLDGVRVVSQWALGAPLSYWPALLVCTALIYSAARVSWRCFELPLIRLGRRIGTQVPGLHNNGNKT